MAQVLVLYNKPADPEAFNKYYFETHLPIAKRIPGLRSFTVSEGVPVAVSGTSPAPHLIAELGFDSMEDLHAAWASKEGMATAGDLANFADAGATVLIFETKRL
jgi:uncharacterized protein (TIGR02118 family)